MDWIDVLVSAMAMCLAIGIAYHQIPKVGKYMISKAPVSRVMLFAMLNVLAMVSGLVGLGEAAMRLKARSKLALWGLL